MPISKIIPWLAITLGAIAVLAGLNYRADLPYNEVKATYETPDSKWIDILGSQIHYTDQGTGPTLVFIHGSGANLGAYVAITATLSNQGYRTISLDLPGSGLSLASSNMGFHNTDYVTFVEAFMAKLNIEPKAIIGHSTGGQIAWNLALIDPQLFERLILIAPTGQPTPSPLTWRIAQTPILGPMLKNMTPAYIVRQNLKEAVFKDDRIDEATVTRYLELLLREGARDALLARMQNVTFERIEYLPCITLPTLLLWGDQDEWLPVTLSKLFADAIPNTTLINLPNIGHNLPEEVNPNTFASILDKWLSMPLPVSPTLQSAHCFHTTKN